MHTIDISKFSLRTDLAIDSRNAINISNYKKKIIDNNVYVEDINIDSKELSNELGKDIGLYKTITFKDITDSSNFNQVLKVFSNEFRSVLNENNIKKEATVLIIGLGNKKSTPDSLGPKVLSNILVTKHLFKYGEVEDGYRDVSIFEPGVTGETGIETSDSINAIAKEVKPDFIIVIDALATNSIDRLNKTIQITNSGIIPGSGVDNSRVKISKEVLNVPTIAIGIPTIIDSAVIVSDTIKYLIKKFSYDKNNFNNKVDKFKTKIDYTKNDKEHDNEDKKELLGIVGTLSDEELLQLVFEVLSPIDYDYMVTPKEIDFLIDKLSLLIGKGLNNALHKNKIIYTKDNI